MQALNIHCITASSALGLGLSSQFAALRDKRSGLRQNHFLDTGDLNTWIAAVNEIEHCDFPDSHRDWRCRNNTLAWLALQQDNFFEQVNALLARFDRRRVGVFLGTSTSGILSTEIAYRELQDNEGHLPSWYHYEQTHNNFSLTAFVADIFNLQGPAFTVSTACSSSAKVVACAQRFIDLGLIDAALIGGVDSLCLTTLYGFHSLQLLSSQPCRPCDAERDGISIGEAAAFAFLSRSGDTDTKIYGLGESSDAYHMSSPHPEGRGAADAMRAALTSAGLNAGDIDYINLHGTGTRANDAAECAAVSDIFGGDTPCSSTKAWTGHTLGAAGALELAIATLALRHNFLPANLGLGQLDPELRCNVLRDHQCDRSVRRVLSNSFGFGGSNCSLIVGCDK